MKQIKTFCRVCEPSCGLEATVDGASIVKIAADKEHPVSKGFVCHKGINSLDIHNDPDRLNFPRKKTDTGFEQTSWDSALEEISQKINQIKEQYGSQAFGAYIGNPMGFNVLAGPAMSSFLMQLGCMKNFNAGTQDCSNKFAGAEAVYGTSTLHPLPDIEHTNLCLIIGSNPKVSHMSFISIANPMEKIKQAKKRGAKFVYINPRKIESCEDDDQLLQIKPDTDTYLLAALINEIITNDLHNKQCIDLHAKGFAGLKQFVSLYPAERVENITGISKELIANVAYNFATVKKASAFMSVGANMGQQGTLCYWLLQMLVFITGNLNRKGGNLYSQGFYPATKAGRFNTQTSPFFQTTFGEMRAVRGALPGNMLADMIQTQDNPIRALFVIGGNPLLSIGGSNKLAKALGKLELLVCIDLYQNATGEFAHYLLPAADMLERPDVNIIGLGMQYQPHIQYTDAVVEPKYERKPEWWILGQLEQALGFKSVFDDPEFSEDSLFIRTEKMMKSTGKTLTDVKAAPSHTIVLNDLTEGDFFDQLIQQEDHKIDCYPTLLKESIDKCETIFQNLLKEDENQIKLINLRNPYTHNSWFQNIEKLRSKKPDNALYLNEKDAHKLGIEQGDEITISNQFGTIKAHAAFDNRLRNNVVAMTHGWGNQQSTGMRIAKKFPGVNVNDLLPSGPGTYEKISNQAHMTGIPVTINKL